MIDQGFIIHLEKVLSAEFIHDVRIFRNSPVSGGCINHAHKIESSVGNFFIKFNSKSRFPGMFNAEAKGLALLNKSGSIRTPEVILTGTYQAFSFIILEFIEAGKRGEDYWENAGFQLAKLHRNTSAEFGLAHDNYIGSLPQSNKLHEDWIAFFISERLLAIGKEIIHPFIDKLEKSLNERIPREVPALLHGDLWSGNIMCGPDGLATFFDPAVYNGHREMDLAMTRLFGGFSLEFYKAYHAEFPLENGFEERVDLHNLYPLLVHVNLFGGSYIDQVNAILNRL